MTYPRNSSRAKLARFNWYILLFCALVLCAGAVLSGIAAIILAGTQGVTFLAYVVALVLSIGLFIGAGVAISKMELC